MSNKWIWFSLGDNNGWYCGVINANLDPKTLKFEEGRDNYVPANRLTSGPTWYWNNLRKQCYRTNDIIRAIKESYQLEEDVYINNKDKVHLYNIFDLDIVNEYGIAKGLWE